MVGELERRRIRRLDAAGLRQRRGHAGRGDAEEVAALGLHHAGAASPSQVTTCGTSGSHLRRVPVLDRDAVDGAHEIDRRRRPAPRRGRRRSARRAAPSRGRRAASGPRTRPSGPRPAGVASTASGAADGTEKAPSRSTTATGPPAAPNGTRTSTEVLRLHRRRGGDVVERAVGAQEDHLVRARERLPAHAQHRAGRTAPAVPQPRAHASRATEAGLEATVTPPPAVTDRGRRRGRRDDLSGSRARGQAAHTQRRRMRLSADCDPRSPSGTLTKRIPRPPLRARRSDLRAAGTIQAVAT